ncbi:MAG TPA: four helix bundle protein [Pyrinomonadaceae bacterium]|nr:four helix bundle protein [Pyrinomonadaceae bacterium]
MDEEELKRRTKRFGLRIMKLVLALPKTPQGRTVGGQLVRAGTSVGANYRAACRARSRAEFTARLGVVEEEADESGYWLEMIIEGGLMKAKLVEALLIEANELVAIMTSSRITIHRKQLADKQNATRVFKSKINNQKSKIQ